MNNNEMSSAATDKATGSFTSFSADNRGVDISQSGELSSVAPLLMAHANFLNFLPTPDLGDLVGHLGTHLGAPLWTPRPQWFC